MIARLLTPVLLAVGLLPALVQASIVTVSKATLKNLEIKSAPGGNTCRASSDPNLFELVIATTAGKTYGRKFCYGIDGSEKWVRLYEKSKILVKGIPSQECIVAEYCDEYGACRKLYGDTVIEKNELILFTSAEGEVKDFDFVLKTKCERRLKPTRGPRHPGQPAEPRFER